jgi:hypothetical protein
MGDGIRVKAGRRAYEIIQDGGFSLDSITAYFAPGAGPRWLVASGFDLTLLRNELLGRSRSVLLAGSSAGAWRFAAWLQPEAEKSYRTLMEAYIGAIYKKADTPETILNTLCNIINAYIEDDALPFALAHKKYRLAVITARARHLAASEIRGIQQIGLGLCFLANAVNRSYLYGFFERVVFYYAPKPPYFCLHSDFKGQYIPLSEINFKAAVLASGAIPLVVAGVKDVFGAPRGVYRDGGVVDYHLSQPYASGAGEVTLFFHHQERIIPGWLDKRLDYRRVPESFLDNVLMIYPSKGFMDRLPGGKIPDRDDFVTFMDDPAARIKNWRRAVELSAPLGEQFLELVESRKLKDVVEKM